MTITTNTTNTFTKQLSLVAIIVIIFTGYSIMAAQSDSDVTIVGEVLDSFHAAAAEGDWDSYFALMNEDGVFLGTDASERWTKEEFQAYASGSSGWIYRSAERHINLTPDGNTAWFDEILDSASYGTARGSGVLIRTGSGWEVSQYHLTFPIPNELVDELIESIKSFNNRQ